MFIISSVDSHALVITFYGVNNYKKSLSLKLIDSLLYSIFPNLRYLAVIKPCSNGTTNWVFLVFLDRKLTLHLVKKIIISLFRFNPLIKVTVVGVGNKLILVLNDMLRGVSIQQLHTFLVTKKSKKLYASTLKFRYWDIKTINFIRVTEQASLNTQLIVFALFCQP